MARVGRRSNDSERTVRFLQIVRGESLQAKHLMLPKSFTRFYWRNAPTRVTLVLPGHRTWEMEVVKDEHCRVWLRAGWVAFADFYSLAHCSVLHFTYRGGSELLARVYSKSCLEIEYPPPPAVPDSSSTDLEADSVEDSDYQEEEQTIKEEEEDEDEDDEEFEDVSTDRVHRHAELPVFVATITAAHIKFYQAHIPADFSEKHIDESDDCVILKMGNKAWNVKLNRQGGKFRYPKLSAGWFQFARDNSLRVGDTCVFQLLQKVPVLVFEVAIVRL